MTASQRPPGELAALCIHGDDRVAFLQGQLSCDVRLLEQQAVIDGAWLNPSGRVITVVQLLSTGSAIGLFLPSELIDGVAERLTKFRFRSKVEIDAAIDWYGGFGIASPLAERPLNGSPTPETFGDAPASRHAEWRLARLRAGIPWIGTETTEQFTAHQLNLDRLGAVSFTKGCYSGQEIVARTEHRGKVKRRLAHFASDSDAIAIGDAITTATGTKVGTVVDLAPTDEGLELLGLLPIDNADSLICADIALQRVA
ncbi:MAG: hypothetical protein AAGC71_04245 [Pseudomonadota bacterium]